jgi:hypothetical protein
MSAARLFAFTFAPACLAGVVVRAAHGISTKTTTTIKG